LITKNKHAVHTQGCDDTQCAGEVRSDRTAARRLLSGLLHRATVQRELPFVPQPQRSVRRSGPETGREDLVEHYFSRNLQVLVWRENQSGGDSEEMVFFALETMLQLESRWMLSLTNQRVVHKRCGSETADLIEFVLFTVNSFGSGVRLI